MPLVYPYDLIAIPLFFFIVLRLKLAVPVPKQSDQYTCVNIVLLFVSSLFTIFENYAFSQEYSSSLLYYSGTRHMKSSSPLLPCFFLSEEKRRAGRGPPKSLAGQAIEDQHVFPLGGI